MDGVGCACETLSFVPPPPSASIRFRVLKIEKVTDKIFRCPSRIDMVRSEMTESPQSALVQCWKRRSMKNKRDDDVLCSSGKDESQSVLYSPC